MRERERESTRESEREHERERERKLLSALPPAPRLSLHIVSPPVSTIIVPAAIRVTGVRGRSGRRRTTFRFERPTHVNKHVPGPPGFARNSTLAATPRAPCAAPGRPRASGCPSSLRVPPSESSHAMGRGPPSFRVLRLGRRDSEGT